MEEFVRSLQIEIVDAFEKLDSATPAFKRDWWTRA
jgi:coproporphyrinogen III oxidase